MPPHICAVTAPGETVKRGHMLVKLAQVWAENGCSIAYGSPPQLDASIGILHIDRTVIDPSIVPANPDGRPFLNSGVLDISKRRVSANLLDRDSDWDGPVLIKTDANAFGLYEIDRKPGWSLPKRRSQLARYLPWRLLRELPRRDYPIMRSLREVPDWVWERSDLIVERFLPERVGDRFALRIWMFLGDREYGAIIYSNNPIVKTDGILGHEYIFEFPDSLRAIRRQLGFDYGKFDYVMVDGEAVLLDVNRTPSIQAGPITSNIRNLASGIDSYLGRS